MRSKTSSCLWIIRTIKVDFISIKSFEMNWIIRINGIRYQGGKSLVGTWRGRQKRRLSGHDKQLMLINSRWSVLVGPSGPLGGHCEQKWGPMPRDKRWEKTKAETQQFVAFPCWGRPIIIRRQTFNLHKSFTWFANHPLPFKVKFIHSSLFEQKSN